MKPPPPGWPRISVALFYDDPVRAIEWLCKVFGFDLRLRCDGPDGSLLHSELVLGGGVVMVAGAGGGKPRPEPLPCKSPRSLGGANTQSLCVYIDEVDAHCARVRAAGAVIKEELQTNDYGPEYWADRSYRVEDLEGHQWWFVQRMR